MVPGRIRSLCLIALAAFADAMFSLPNPLKRIREQAGITADYDLGSLASLTTEVLSADDVSAIYVINAWVA
jgi:hypothetical protein